MEDKMRELAAVLAKQFEEDFYKVAVREMEEEDFLNKRHFTTARDRAAEGIRIATKGVTDTLGLAIAISYEVKDDDNTAQEQTDLLEAEANPEIGTRGWWNDSK